MRDRLYENSYSNLRENYESIKRSHRKLRYELSNVDKQVSELYHDLEKTDLTEELGYQYSVALQNLLRKRRVIKDEYIPFDILRNNFRDSFEKSHKALSKNQSSSNRVRTSLNVSIAINDVLDI